MFLFRILTKYLDCSMKRKIFDFQFVFLSYIVHTKRRTFLSMSAIYFKRFMKEMVRITFEKHDLYSSFSVPTAIVIILCCTFMPYLYVNYTFMLYFYVSCTFMLASRSKRLYCSLSTLFYIIFSFRTGKSKIFKWMFLLIWHCLLLFNPRPTMNEQKTY